MVRGSPSIVPLLDLTVLLKSVLEIFTSVMISISLKVIEKGMPFPTVIGAVKLPSPSVRIFFEIL